MELSEAAKEARREYMRKWRQEHREHVVEYQRKYAKDHRERANDYARAGRRKNLEKAAASQKRYWEKKLAQQENNTDE